MMTSMRSSCNRSSTPVFAALDGFSVRTVTSKPRALEGRLRRDQVGRTATASTPWREHLQVVVARSSAATTARDASASASGASPFDFLTEP